MRDKGLLAFSNQRLEWMLPWWVETVRAHSNLPITFIDAGLSKRMRKWCRSKGDVIKLEDQIPVASRQKVAPEQQKLWESLYFGDVWESRKAWFLKPQVLNLTPYQKTLYLDIDCQVVSEIDSLFDLKSECALVEEKGGVGQLLPATHTIYNSGVILYEKNAPLIVEWQEAAKFNTHKFMGDEDLLSALIHEKYSVHTLDARFNCRPSSPKVNSAHIIHHVGLQGKRDILSFMLESFSEVV